MRIRIFHQFAYVFDPPAKALIQALKLTPRNHEGQYVASWRIDVDVESRLRSSVDALANVTHLLSIAGPLETFTLTVDGVVETHDTAGVLRGTVERFPPTFYLRESRLTGLYDDVRAFAAECRNSAGGDTLQLLHTLMNRLHSTTRDDGTALAGRMAEASGATLEGRAQPLAHAFIASARCLGIPARFVSGYLWRDGPEAEARAPHGWAEAFVEGLGWVGFDPVMNLCPAAQHVRVSIGLDGLDAAPVRTSRQGFGEERLDERVRVMAQSQSQS